MHVLWILVALSCSVLIDALPSISFFQPSNLTEFACASNYSWTTWFNSAHPKTSQDFDQEIISVIRQGRSNDICASPQGMQAQTVSALTNGVQYTGSWQTVNGSILSFVSRTPGVDFQVRFCCIDKKPAVLTTLPPRANDSLTCGRPQIKPSLKLQRVFGGSRATPHSWPWQVTYQEKAICNQRKTCTDNCGGTILDANHVLTAAHCVGGKNLSDIVITAGVHYRSSNETETRQLRGVDRLYMHPDWEPSTMGNDLALLRLDKPVEFNKYVQPVCLPVAEPQTNANVVLTGWGAEALGGGLFDELKQAQVKVIGDCGRFWNLLDEKIQLCVGQPVSGDSACQGDSGGPLVQEFNGQWVLQGVTSYIGDCKTNENYAPNVYSKVFTYVTWIKSIIG